MGREAALFGRQGPRVAAFAPVRAHAPNRPSVAELRRQPPLLRPSEAFGLIGISRSAGYAWIQAGDIPVQRLGGRLWVRTVDLAERVFGIPPLALLEDDTEVAPLSGGGLSSHEE